MKNFKIKVTPEQSRIVQEELFERKCRWNFWPDWLDKEFFCLDSPYLYLTNNSITWGGVDFYSTHPHPELTFEEFKTKYIRPMKTDMKERIEQLENQLDELKAELKEATEDKRVDFGEEYIIDRLTSETECFIGDACAKPGDANKVLIPVEGYKWQLYEDYYDGRNAVSLVKI